MTVKIFIGNLGEESDQDELQNMFMEHGEVVECHVCGRFGFVHMAKEEEAQSAINAVNGIMYKGNRINVELSTGVNRRNEPGWKEGGGEGGGGRGGGPMRGRGMGRGRGGDRGGRGGRGGEPYPPRRTDPYARDPYDPYARRALDPYDEPRMPPYGRDPYVSRLERDPYLRESLLRDPYVREMLGREAIRPPVRERDPLRDPYSRPPPEYYRDGYSARGATPDDRQMMDPYFDRRPKGELPPPKSYMSERPFADRYSALDRSAGDRQALERDPYERRMTEKSFASASGVPSADYNDSAWSRPQNGQGSLGGMGNPMGNSMSRVGAMGGASRFGNGTY